jgi:hypothetical protein
MAFSRGLLVLALLATLCLLADARTLKDAGRLPKDAEAHSPGWAEFESDFWFIVKPLKWGAYIAFAGLLAILGILGPIMHVIFNICSGCCRCINEIFRNAIWPIMEILINICIRIATLIKCILEFFVRVFFEPLWNFVLHPIIKFSRAHSEAVAGSVCLIAGAILLAFSLLDTGTGALQPLARFVPHGQCIDERPSLSFSVAAFQVVAYVGGCFIKHPETAAMLATAVFGGLLFSVGAALISHNMGVPGAPQLFLLPLRAALAGLAGLLAPFGAVLALQACARLVHVDIGIDSMYMQLFGLDPSEGSVAQMEVAGTLEMVAGLGMLSIGLRLLGLALMFNMLETGDRSADFKIMVQQGAFWYWLPLVRAGLAGRLGCSLLFVGLNGFYPLHIGCFTAFGIGVIMCARAVTIIGGYIGSRQMMSCLSCTWRPVVAVQFVAYSYLFTLSCMQSQDPIALVLFGLCAAGSLSIALLTIAQPPQLWNVGDQLLSHIEWWSSSFRSWNLEIDWKNSSNEHTVWC